MLKKTKTIKNKVHKNNKLNDLTGSEWIKFTKSWFILHPKHRNKKEIIHPAKYPEELVQRFVSFFTKKGQFVLDPFCGVGSTSIGCESLNRNSVGIDISKKYISIAKQRLKQINAKNKHIILKGSSSNLIDIWQKNNKSLPKKVDFIMTSPPYWDMLNKSRGNVLSTHKKRKLRGLDIKYSDSNEDLGNISDYKDFLKSLKKIFYQCYKVLKDNRYMVVVLQNLRVKDGSIYTLAWDLVNEISKKFVFVGEQIWIQDDKRLGIWGYPSTYVSNIHHHYCLILHKKVTYYE